MLTFTKITKEALELLLQESVELIRLADMLHKTEWGRTSLDDNTLLTVRNGNRKIDEVSVSVFKLDDKDMFAVFVESSNPKNNRYYYTKDFKKESLREKLEEITNTYIHRYKKQYARGWN